MANDDICYSSTSPVVRQSLATSTNTPVEGHIDYSPLAPHSGHTPVSFPVKSSPQAGHALGLSFLRVRHLMNQIAGRMADRIVKYGYETLKHVIV